MPIEFRCTQCGALLRTGDDTAGQQAQCPACGSLCPIPGFGPTAGPPPGLAPLQVEPAGSPLGSTTPSASQYAGVTASERVFVPATALRIAGIFGMLLQAAVIMLNALHMFGIPMGLRGPDALPIAFGTSLNIVVGVIGLIISAVVAYGALKMKHLENHGLAMTAAILSVIPCTSPCCFLGFPFGIWAIVVLNDSTVRDAFRS